MSTGVANGNGNSCVATADNVACPTTVPNYAPVPKLHNANEEQHTRYYCSFSPVYKKLAVAEQTVFALQCFDIAGSSNAPIPCPTEIQLYSNAGTPTLGELQSIYTRTINFVAGSAPLTGGVLRATMSYPDDSDDNDNVNGGPFSCQANVDVYTKAEFCVIQPSTATLTVDDQMSFSVSCYAPNNAVVLPPVSADSVGSGSQGSGTAVSAQSASQSVVAAVVGATQLVPCPTLVWSSDAGTVSGSTTGATLTAVNAGSGKFLMARYVAPSSVPEEGFYCTASVNVNAKTNPTPTPTPNGGGGSPGGMIYLPGGSGGSGSRATPTPAPTQAPAAPSPSPSPRPTMGHLVLHAVTATPSPVTAFAAPSGLTGLFTAQLAPLALGLFLGIIAVVLLWYYLAGGGKKSGGAEAKTKAGEGKAAK